MSMFYKAMRVLVSRVLFMEVLSVVSAQSGHADKVWMGWISGDRTLKITSEREGGWEKNILCCVASPQWTCLSPLCH